MPGYQRILFIADPQMRQSPGFLRALELARASGATLFLELFDYAPAVDAVGALSAETRDLAQRAWLQDRQGWLQAQADAVKTRGVRIETLAHWAHPLHRTVLDRILDLAPDLVVKDARHETTLDRILLHPLDWHLIHGAAATLLLVSPRAPLATRRVLAAVDPAHGWNRRGDLNARIVQAAADLAALSGAGIEYVHAFEGVPPMVAASVEASAGDMAAMFESFRDSRRRQFDALADAFQARPEQRHFVLGPAPQALAELGGTGDVIALGAVHHSLLGRIAIGSVAEAILDQIRCDALLVKPEGFREHALAQRSARELPAHQPATDKGRRLAAS